MENKITSLRDALALLKEMPGQLVETHVEVDPAAELSGVYRYVGAGGKTSDYGRRPCHDFSQCERAPGCQRGYWRNGQPGTCSQIVRL